MQIYSTTVPPDYDLSRITTPIALFTADNDWIVTEKVSSLNKYLHSRNKYALIVDYIQ